MPHQVYSKVAVAVAVAVAVVFSFHQSTAINPRRRVLAETVAGLVMDLLVSQEIPFVEVCAFLYCAPLLRILMELVSF